MPYRAITIILLAVWLCLPAAGKAETGADPVYLVRLTGAISPAEMPIFCVRPSTRPMRRGAAVLS